MSDFKRLLELAVRGQALGREGAREAMGLILSGEAGEVRAAALLGALQARGPKGEELVGFALALRERAVRVPLRRSPVVDTCGTGGDGLDTFNFSTAAAIVVAGCGVAVAKHGNRSVSSKSGSADVLEALGVEVEAPPERAARSIEEAGFGFLYAPLYHPAMKSVAALRRGLGVRTVFNLIGPLVNPAGVVRQVVGIYDPAFLETYARVLADLGALRAMVVCAEDGMDELSLASDTKVLHVEAGRVWGETVTPEGAGLKRARPAALRGGDAQENAGRLEELLGGKDSALAEGTFLNAAAALVVAGRASDLKEGVERARLAVASGEARSVLEKLRRLKGGAA